MIRFNKFICMFLNFFPNLKQHFFFDFEPHRYFWPKIVYCYNTGKIGYLAQIVQQTTFHNNNYSTFCMQDSCSKVQCSTAQLAFNYHLEGSNYFLKFSKLMISDLNTHVSEHK